MPAPKPNPPSDFKVRIVVGPPTPLTIVTVSPLPAGSLGVAYSTTIQAIGGVFPYIWSTPLPVPGLTINAATGVLSGTPTLSGPNVPLIVGLLDARGTTITANFAIPITGDTTAPTVPTGLAANVISTTEIDLSWNASTDTGGSGLAGYRLYRGGVQIAQQPGLTFQDLGLTPATQYSYQVSAYDNAGNESAKSSAVVATTQSSGSTISNNQFLTINGTGFGTKSVQVPPQVADAGIDAPPGSLSPQWTAGQSAPTLLSGIYNMQNEPVGFSPSGALIGAPHPFITTLQSGCHQFYAGSQPSDPAGALTGNDVGVSKSMISPTTSYCWRQAYWLKIDPNLFIDPQSDQNTKMANYNMAAVFYPGNGNFIYTTFQANASILVNALRQFTAGNPTTISVALPLAANPFVVGKRVCFTGMPSTHLGLNNVTGNITAIGGVNNNWSATLALDTTGFASFTTSARSVVSIDATNPAVVHFTDSGPTNPCAIGSMVNFFGVTGMTSINNQSANVQIFVTHIGGTSPNYTATVNFNGGATPGSGGLMYIGMAPTPFYPDITVNPLLVTDGNEQPSSAPMWDLPDNLGHSSSFMSRVFHPANLTVGWCRVVAEGCIDATVGGPGYYKETWYSQGLNQVKIGTYGSFYSGRTTNAAGMASGHFNVQMGNYMRDRSNNNFRHYCDGSVDITGPGVTGQCAVVYVGDNPVFASCLVKQEQVAATWTNTQITIPHFKQGALQSGTTGYIHICRETDPVGTALANGSFTIGATSVPVITNASLPNANVNNPYSASVIVTGGTAPYTFYLPTVLPNTGNWLTINSSSGALSGTPGTLETENVFIGVKDANGYTAFANLSLSVTATTFDFFISTTGSDSNPGTLASPWAITAVNTKQATYSGKKVGLIAGTYNIQALAASRGSGANGYLTPTLQPNGSASAVSPTYFASCDSNGNYLAPNASAADGSKCGAIITCKVGSVYGNPNNNNGSGNARAGNIMFGFWAQGGLPPNPANVTIDGIGFTGNISGNVTFGNAGATAISGITIKNCEFFDNSGVGSEVGDNLTFMSLVLLNGVVQNNYCHDAVGYSAGSMDHLSAILLWHPTSGITIQNNTVVNCGPIFGKSQGTANPDIEGSVVRWNYVDCSSFTSGQAGSIEDFGDSRTATTQLYGNICIGAQPMQCYRVEGGGTAGPMQIYSNTCVITSGGDKFGIGTSVDGSLQQYNNVVYNNSGSAMNEGFLLCTTGTLGTCNFNGYFRGAGADKWTKWTDQAGATGFTSLAAWQTATGKEANSIAATVSPLFVGPTTTLAGAYKFQAGSVCIGAGRVGGTSAGTVIDMGAWGYATNQGVTIGSTLKP